MNKGGDDDQWVCCHKRDDIQGGEEEGTKHTTHND